MKSIFVILVFLFIGMTSCIPMEDQDLEQNKTETSDTGTPPVEETGEDGDLVPNE